MAYRVVPSMVSQVWHLGDDLALLDILSYRGHEHRIRPFEFSRLAEQLGGSVAECSQPLRLRDALKNFVILNVRILSW